MSDTNILNITHGASITAGILALVLSAVAYSQTSANTVNEIALDLETHDEAGAMVVIANAHQVNLIWGPFAFGLSQAIANGIFIWWFDRSEKADNISSVQRAHKLKVVLAAALVTDAGLAIADLAFVIDLALSPIASLARAAIAGAGLAFLASSAAAFVDMLWFLTISKRSLQHKAETFSEPTEYEYQHVA